VQVPEGELSSAEALRIVVQVATALREHDLQDPVPYRLMRTMRWSVLQAAPPHTDGRTQIPAPDDDQRAALNRLAERGAHEKLLTVAEQTFQEGSFHLWLDLQHLAVRAAASLGGGYQAVAEALRHETALLLRRVPALSTLSFRDGTPFASPAVQGWLETIQAEPGDSGGGASGDDDKLAAALQEARSALGGGSLDEALDIIDEADHDDSDRSRFRQRLYAARLCLDGGRPEAARPLLEALDADIATYHLDEWEPALAQTVWERLYICYTRLHAPDDGRDFAEAAADVYRRLCRLDVKAALALPPIGDTA
jgi:type VI secretion system protein VasJ